MGFVLLRAQGTREAANSKPAASCVGSGVGALVVEESWGVARRLELGAEGLGRLVAGGSK